MPITGADIIRYKSQHKPRTASQLAVEALTSSSSPPDADVLRAIGLKSPPRTSVRVAQNHTTTTNTAPVNPGHALPVNRPRVAHLYTCDDCGQSWTITGEGGVFNRRPVRFCPACGTEAIQHASSPFGGLECGAIKELRVERKLAQMLYQQWAANRHHEQGRRPRFVDYLKEQLS